VSGTAFSELLIGRNARDAQRRQAFIQGGVVFRPVWPALAASPVCLRMCVRRWFATQSAEQPDCAHEGDNQQPSSHLHWCVINGVAMLPIPKTPPLRRWNRP
jgi:hypothetical protein